MRKRNKKGEMKTTCSKCNKPVEESRKGQRYCKGCHAEYMRENRPKHRDLMPLAKKKANCRAYANVYFNRGKIDVTGCKICGDKAEKHHENYDKPLEILWLCRKHHLELHNKTELKTA